MPQLSPSKIEEMQRRGLDIATIQRIAEKKGYVMPDQRSYLQRVSGGFAERGRKTFEKGVAIPETAERVAETLPSRLAAVPLASAQAIGYGAGQTLGGFFDIGYEALPGGIRRGVENVIERGVTKGAEKYPGLTQRIATFIRQNPDAVTAIETGVNIAGFGVTRVGMRGAGRALETVMKKTGALSEKAAIPIARKAEEASIQEALEITKPVLTPIQKKLTAQQAQREGRDIQPTFFKPAGISPSSYDREVAEAVRGLVSKSKIPKKNLDAIEKTIDELDLQNKGILGAFPSRAMNKAQVRNAIMKEAQTPVHEFLFAGDEQAKKVYESLVDLFLKHVDGSKNLALFEGRQAFDRVAQPLLEKAQKRFPEQGGKYLDIKAQAVLDVRKAANQLALDSLSVSGKEVSSAVKTNLKRQTLLFEAMRRMNTQAYSLSKRGSTLQRFIKILNENQGVMFPVLTGLGIGAFFNPLLVFALVTSGGATFVGLRGAKRFLTSSQFLEALSRFLKTSGRTLSAEDRTLLQKIEVGMRKSQVGLSLKDVSRAGDEGTYQVGITNVAGKLSFNKKGEFSPFTRSDELFAEAKQLLKDGKADQAQRKYNEALSFGAKKIKQFFDGSGIKIHTRAGLGVFDATAEPSIDMSAIVPKGKEDLFHYKLAQLGDTSFAQKSVITYRSAQSNVLGVIDEEKGISNEPFIRIMLKKTLELSGVAEIKSLLDKHNLAGASIREVGKVVDIINLTHYNKDYDRFKQGVKNFQKDLDGRGLLSGVTGRNAEVRHFGSSYADAPTTYRDIRSNFLKQNPHYKPRGDQTLTSRVLEKLPDRELISKSELWQFAASPDIPLAEKELVETLLKDLPNKVKVRDFEYAMRKSLLRIKPEYSDSYANYGLDQLDLNYSGAKTIIFRTPIKHGVGGHFGTGDDFGHVRVFEQKKELVTDLRKTKPNKDALFVSELQSDPFQRGIILDETRTPQGDRDLRTTPLTSQEKQLKSFESDNKYRRRLLEEVLLEAQKRGYKEVNLPTPSTVSRIEWNKANPDDAIPYRRPDDTSFTPDDELKHGDGVQYLDDEYVVVQDSWNVGRGGGDNNGIVLAPKDKVHSFKFSEYVEENIKNNWDERVIYDLKGRMLGKKKVETETDLEKMTEEQAQKLLDAESALIKKERAKNKNYSGWDMGDEYLQHRIDGLDHEGAKQKMFEKFSEWASQDNLEDLYGKDRVFYNDISRGRGDDYKVYILDESATAENFSQPSSYQSFVSAYDLPLIDKNKGLLDEYGFSQTEKGVLDNYYEMEKNLRKIQRETDIKVTPIEIENRNGEPVTWINVKLNKNIRKSAF